MNIPTVAALLLTAGWPQFGRDSSHTGSTTVPALPLQAVLASVVMDPFVDAELAVYGEDLFVHYAAPIVDGDDVFIEMKGGTFTPQNWSTQTWGVQAFRWKGNGLVPRWTVTSDWKPVPFTGGGVGPTFEPVFQPVLANDFLYMPGAGGSVLRVNRDTGEIVDRLGATAPLDPATFVSGPLVVPPSPTAVPRSGVCGSQRPGVNVAPAIAPNGTLYTVSRAHFNSRWAYLVALNPDLTPKWTASLRDRLNDGCNVTLPANGASGGCRAGAFTGVDPADNTAGAGRVIDDSSSSPLIAPDGTVFYGAYTRYNYAQGHLMHFTAAGAYLGSYPFGWDITPGIYSISKSYVIIMKENHYPIGSYCDACPSTRRAADPQGFFVMALDPSLNVRWSLKSPTGFEWCINGPAIDGNGVSYINSEDGKLYAINPDGSLRESIRLTEALGQAYTPVVVDDRGRIYAEKAGVVFVVGAPTRHRALR